MKFIILSFLLSYSPRLFGQQINGTWKGKMYSSNSMEDTVLVEFEITGKNNNNLSGYSICHFYQDNFAKTSLTGKYDSVKNEVYFEEKRIVEQRMPESAPLFLDEYYLNLDSKGNLAGIVRCKELAMSKSYIRIPCHADMYIDLVRQ
jgi:hypothetical protein